MGASQREFIEKISPARPLACDVFKKTDARPTGRVSATKQQNKFVERERPRVTHGRTARDRGERERERTRWRPSLTRCARWRSRDSEVRAVTTRPRAREKHSPPQLPHHAPPPSISPLSAQVARWPTCGTSLETRNTRSRSPIRRRTPRSRDCCATRAPESCGFSSNSRNPP